ncbi:tRNA-dihydrouridine(16/17) synthase [NAD(P)(+)]-like isoform X2 [Cimex lectularius]|uniref:tRNA-dihydrouridine(16/17) synthase [NAD(P)(+)] n=1 Tax=Cimex lectularius TaxID=79782 RepID=A0A8I6SPS2_CIMLE|nr:tRNA-dihydrouridine(16/17) synthase [NAD(P)(+)]-like isoform X2 [Cimex lectularius]
MVYWVRLIYQIFEMSEGGFELWERLGCPRHIVAPMVDASELPWRLLSRAHGAQLCYSPMFHSLIFTKDPKYRKEALFSSERDRPLIIQFCGNKPDVMLQAAKLAEPYCDAVDINLGCPQAIAKRGNYGAFLQDDWNLLSDIVQLLSKGLNVPVTCKIRVFESIEKTVNYAQMLEKAGCKMLTVHGRTREQKGPLTGLASWDHIKAVRENVKIPILANGNIQCSVDITNCIEATGCQGVMTAEGNLYNPFIFEGVYPPAWEPALEYLDLVEQFPCPNSYVRGHIFKLFHYLLSLSGNEDIREEIAKGSCVEDFRRSVLKLRERFLPLHEGHTNWCDPKAGYDLVLPPWLCQPYVRPPPEEHLKKIEGKKTEIILPDKENCDTSGCKRGPEGNETGLSKKKLKKIKRCGRISLNPYCRREVAICSKCPNPMGLKCDSHLCKTCCRTKCYTDEADCPGHGILIKTRREKARRMAAAQNSLDNSKNER